MKVPLDGDLTRNWMQNLTGNDLPDAFATEAAMSEERLPWPACGGLDHLTFLILFS